MKHIREMRCKRLAMAAPCCRKENFYLVGIRYVVRMNDVYGACISTLVWAKRQACILVVISAIICSVWLEGRNGILLEKERCVVTIKFDRIQYYVIRKNGRNIFSMQKTASAVADMAGGIITIFCHIVYKFILLSHGTFIVFFLVSRRRQQTRTVYERPPDETVTELFGLILVVILNCDAAS